MRALRGIQRCHPQSGGLEIADDEAGQAGDGIGPDVVGVDHPVVEEDLHQLEGESGGEENDEGKIAEARLFSLERITPG